MVRYAEDGGTPLSPQDGLEAILRRFDRWIAEGALRSVVETVGAVPPTIEGNREMLGRLRGERQWYEAQQHRSVAKDLGTYLMAALPSSTIIGFTGTPIDRTFYGQGTLKIFGTEDERGYLHKYPIAESIDDETTLQTTLPIHHTRAPSDMTVPVEEFDREFFTAADVEGVPDVAEFLHLARDTTIMRQAGAEGSLSG